MIAILDETFPKNQYKRGRALLMIARIELLLLKDEKNKGDLNDRTRTEK